MQELWVRTKGKTRNAQAGVNNVRSCGELNHIMSIGTDTTTANET